MVITFREFPGDVNSVSEKVIDILSSHLSKNFPDELVKDIKYWINYFFVIKSDDGYYYVKLDFAPTYLLGMDEYNMFNDYQELKDYIAQAYKNHLENNWFILEDHELEEEQEEYEDEDDYDDEEEYEDEDDYDDDQIDENKQNMNYINSFYGYTKKYESIREIELHEFSRNISTNISKREDEMIRNAISPYVKEIGNEMLVDFYVHMEESSPEHLYYTIKPKYHHKIHPPLGEGHDSYFRVYKEDGYYYCNLHIFYYDEPYVGMNEFTSFKELLVYLKLAVTISYYLWDDIAEIISSIDFPMDLTFDNNEIYELLNGTYREKPKNMDSEKGRIKVLNAIKNNPNVTWAPTNK